MSWTAEKLDTSTPILILGGAENALSLTRRFAQFGISVRVSGSSRCWGMSSRHCSEAFRIPRGVSSTDFWKGLLLSENQSLDGHILIPCCDDAILFIAEHREELEKHYLLDGGSSDQRRAMIDKRRTLELAKQAGVDIPNFWEVKSADDLATIRDAIQFPVMVKPIVTHEFAKVMGCKLFVIESEFSELEEKVQLARKHGFDVMIVEMIPGPDSLLSSYYTYMDDQGRNLYHYTKRIQRRYPVGQGVGCCQLTGRLPETEAAGRKFFDGISFRGFGNIEFKRDTRDGKLKIIEVNARFTGPQELIVRSGAPIDLVVYCHLTNQPIPTFKECSQLLCFWHPLKDFRAYLQMRKKGQLNLIQWIKSVLPYELVFPLWNWRDPLPSLVAGKTKISRLLGGKA